MREIIFRGKRRYNGEWVEGSLVHIGDFCAIIEHDQERLHDLDKMYLNANTGSMGGYATKVPFETVGQFTGLIDKNGKKIFEGDIIHYDTLGPYSGPEYYIPHVGPVIFSDQCFLPLTYCVLDTLEVVGNIYDNPEMVVEMEI